MPKLQQSECYQRIRSFDLGPVLSTLDRLQFVTVNQTTGKYLCDVVLENKFTPELKQLLSDVMATAGGEIARAVLRRLAPQQSIPPHVDDWMPAEVDWRRFQLPIVTHPDIVMWWPDDGVGQHLEAGSLYEVRYDRTHAVDNKATDVHRIHMQLDLVGATV